ncbi:lipopolysaccharide assembly protein LapA domain-containing protein [Roseateles sp.]|uniref:lipopolysaccharide assembly protein LapA domain-containing protein n=1 Tax=Roseateles sp. TaxID=1971397 RepID=UPI00395C5696
MRTLVWLLRGFLFFALFAFALNNNHEASLRWFFGHEWRMPQIIIVLIAFGCGCAFGVLAMVPAWWRHRRAARRSDALADPTPPPPPAAPPPHQDGV